MLNTVALIGRLTKEPILKKTQNGKSVTTFTLAVPYDKDHTDFIQCVAWDKVAENLVAYQHKGSLVGVAGRIATRDYDDPNAPDRKVYVTEVVCGKVAFLERKSDEARTGGPALEEPMMIGSDDLPF